MKRFNRKFIKGTNWALAGLMSLFGFSSCNIIGIGGMEYGTPYAEFVVSGKVTDPDGRGLQGANVTVSKVDIHQRATSGFIPDHDVITENIRETSQTSANGDFKYRYRGTPGNDSINIFMKFEDARFEANSAKVTFFKSELKGGKGWSEGRAEKKINIKLKNRKSE
jgi:putative lipoprotein (rSAM/lipoprotein system)